MAERLDSFDFRTIGGKKKYPWELWFDGNVWKLTRGVDFFVRTEGFRSAAMGAAARRGVQIRTSCPDDQTIVIQAYRAEAD